jgi:hypothetical protein
MESQWAPASWIGWSNPTPDVCQLRFERQRVTMLLKALGLEKRILEMYNAYEEYWGVRRLTFETFFEFWPTFPVMLDARSLFATTPWNNWARLARWMTRFRDTFVFKCYRELTARYQKLSDPSRYDGHKIVDPLSRGLPLGMIFPWDGVKGGLILHNGEPLTFGSKFIHEYLDDEDRPARLVVERYAAWVAVISSRWAPESSPPRLGVPPPAPRRPPRLTGRGVVLRPWLVRLCGPRDATVLSWLLRVTGKGANRYERSFRHIRGGALCVRVTCRSLAEEIGFDDDQQARRALDSLDGRGFIAKQPARKGEARRTCVWIDRVAIHAALEQLRTARRERP